jgi:membrane protein YdbS with pleckstrin-like domain
MRTPLQKGEKILLVTYTSWTALVLPFLFSLLLLAVGVIVVFHFTEVWGWLGPVAAVLYWLMRYSAWKVNIWVVTNFRVIDEAGLLTHFAKESPLDKINNISYDQTVGGRLFNYGHVEIQTAAEAGATDYYNVNHPKRLKDTITAAQGEYKNLQYNTQAVQQAAQMAAVLDSRGMTGAAKADAPQIAQELERLFELKIKGALSEEEYNRAKARLLNH